MMNTFDVIVVDIQDLGCRIYTFLSTVFYLLEECAKVQKSIIILDRPNPAGRIIEGTILRQGWESFVGVAPMPIRHGLTLGEAASWYKTFKNLDVDLTVIPMSNYEMTSSPNFGWPIGELAWINPSPNAASLNMARCYSGTVLLEGTTLSEGRGTTRALELFGAPDIDLRAIVGWMQNTAPDWMLGCRIRECYFEPTFHKHKGKFCAGIQLHADDVCYNPSTFKPYRFVALFLKGLRALHPEYEIWRHFAYEYERDKLAIDVINGGTELREWVDDNNATVNDFAKLLEKDEKSWLEQSKEYYLYK